MKKIIITKTLSILALASTALVFAGCGKKDKKVTTKKPSDDEIYDQTLNLKYKAFNGEAEITEILEQGESFSIPKEINGNVVKRVSCTYTSETLKKVTIPNTLQYLTGNGFMNCTNLETVTFESNSSLSDIPSKAFLGTKIKSITIPKSVKTISYESFQDIDTLTSVSFESGSVVSAIGPFAFYGCDGLTTITIPASVEVINESAFEKCTNLSSLVLTDAKNLDNIEQLAFSGCTSLTNIDFSSNTNLKTIGANTFRGCTNLEEVTFNDTLREIGNKAFYNTQKLSSIVLPADLISVGEEAFVSSGITKLEIKSGADTKFGANAFTQYKEGTPLTPDDKKIKELKANGNLTIDEIFSGYAKYVRTSLEKLEVTGTKIAPLAYKGCTKLTNLTIANTVTIMGESAFEDCTGITEVSLNTGLTEVATNLFKNCTKLKNVSLPSTVKTIRTGAFDGCVEIGKADQTLYPFDLSNVNEIESYAFRNTAIATPTFSNKLSLIGEYAFDGCLNIAEVVIATDDVTTMIRKYAFTNCKNIEKIDLSANVVTESSVFANDINVKEIKVSGEYGIETLFGESYSDVAGGVTKIFIQDGTKKIEANAFKGCLQVTQINIPDTVTEIGDEAFRGCKGIVSLTLNSNITKIGKYAFADCDNLVINELPANITEISEGLFQNDFAIGAFRLNAKVTKIDDYAFSGCTNITIQQYKADQTLDSNLSDDVTYIGDYAFFACVKVAFSKLPAKVERIGEFAFDECLSVTIEKTTPNLNYIGQYAFKGCQNITAFEFVKDLGADDVNGLGFGILEGCTKINKLKIYGTTSLLTLFGQSAASLKPILSDITIKSGSTSLADDMFNGFTAISSVTFEDTVTKIGARAFQDCESLTSFDDLDKVLIVGDNAFAGSGLQSITIPSNGIELGDGVFAGCRSLSELKFAVPSETSSLNINEIPDETFMDTIITDIVLPDSVTKIGSKAFSGILTLNEFTINETSSLVEIGDNAFEGCSNFKELLIPENVETIGKEAFMSCQALHEVVFKNDSLIELINDSTFKNCYALYSINLPKTIRYIGVSAFENCTCLVDLTLPESLGQGENNLGLGDSAFAGAQSLNNLVIPANITDIPAQCFKNCYMLKNVVWNTAITIIGPEAFYNTPYSTPLPKTLSYIDDKAFASEEGENKPHSFADYKDATHVLEIGCGDDCTSLMITNDVFLYSAVKYVKLGSKIVSVGSGVFAKSDLVSVNFEDYNITKIGDNMFEGCKTLSIVKLATGDNNKINTIGNAAFKETAITTFVFDNILAIGDSAFESCEGLAVAVVLGFNNNVTIGSNAFYKSGITSIKLGEKVIKIGAEAFAFTGGLTRADLSALSITVISDSFFLNCEELSNVIINTDMIKTIEASAFEKTKITSLDFLIIPVFKKETYYSSADSSSLLEGKPADWDTNYGNYFVKDGDDYVAVEGKNIVLEQIMDSAFADCDNLTSAKIPNSVSYVGVSAFSDCDHLTTLVWSTSANIINEGTFNGSGSLNNITIPANVKRISKNAFSTATPVFTFESTTPPSVDEGFIPDAAYSTATINVNDKTAKENYMKNYIFSQLKVTYPNEVYEIKFTHDSNVTITINDVEITDSYTLTDISGDGDVDFKAVLATDYIVDYIDISGSYEDLLDPSGTGVENVYRITNVKSDLTISIILANA